MPIVIARDQVREPLHAIVPVQNWQRWKSRWKHADRAIKHFIDSGAVVTLVECGFNRRELVYADSGLDGTLANCGLNGGEFRHRYIGLHSPTELWVKEGLINLGVQSLPHGWNQVCWLDSDVHFVRPNWVGECIHKLQHGTQTDMAFLQMFSQAQDLGPNYEMLPSSYPHASGIGFVHAWKQGHLKTTLSPEIESDLKALSSDIKQLSTDFDKLEGDIGSEYYYNGPDQPRVWPGLAWACTRPAFEAIGGLPDFAVWGGADFHLGHALIEKTEGMFRSDLHRNYKKMCMQVYERCRTHIRRNVLVMDGAIFHSWHGPKTQRGYSSKHSLLAKFGFDPLRHLKRDSQGLWMLNDDRSTSFVQLRDMLRVIAKERDEDSTYTGLDSHGKQGH